MTAMILIAVGLILYGIISYLVGAYFGSKTAVRLFAHDVLVLENVIEGDPEYDEMILNFLRARIDEAKKPKTKSAWDEWQEEKKRLHDAGIT